MIKAAICDDEQHYLDSIYNHISEEFERQGADIQIQKFSYGVDLLNAHNSEPFDVVFLDIDMPEISGFDIAQQFNQTNKPLIVFVTSHDELVYSSFKFQPFRFIRKNYIKNELPDTIKDIVNIICEHQATKNFEIRTNDGNVFIDLDNVKYIEIFGHWIKIITNNSESIECYGSLSDFEKRLLPYHFIRTHKSYLVNCKYIYSVGQKQVVLDDDTTIPLSKYRVESVREKVRSYLRSKI